MITYTYLCNVCRNTFEVEQSIKDKPLIICNCCNQHSLERVIEGGVYASVRQDPTTLGQQADRNAKKLGKYKIEELDVNRPEPLIKRTENQRKIEKIMAGGKERMQKYIYTGK